MISKLRPKEVRSKGQHSVCSVGAMAWAKQIKRVRKHGKKLSYPHFTDKKTVEEMRETYR